VTEESSVPNLPLYETPRFIAVEGPIRVGKTTLADILAERLGGERLRDVDDNPFLESFYSEKPGAAFTSQLYFLLQRFKQLRELDLSASADRLVVSDYIFEKDKLFAYLNLNDAELRLYEQYYELFAEQVPIPDLVIYLQAKTEMLKKRLEKKNVHFENRIAVGYLKAVVNAYEHFFFRYQSSNLLVIETSEIDFVDRNEDLRQLLERLSQPVRGTQYFLPLGSASTD
jgi:deoxyadenosine/deoxycytidine kinase